MGKKTTLHGHSDVGHVGYSVGRIEFETRGTVLPREMKPMSKAEVKKFKANLDGLDVRLPESAASSDAHLPLPPYKLFRVKDGVMQFRLDETQKWRAVWRLDNDTAYIAMCVADVSLRNGSANMDMSAGRPWMEWFQHRVSAPMEPLPMGLRGEGVSYHTLDDSEIVGHEVEAAGADFGGLDESEFTDTQRTTEGALEASPDMMEAKLTPEKIEAFQKKANAAVLETVLRAAEEIKGVLAKHKGDKLPTAEKWTDYAMKAIPKSVLVELATGPTLGILKYRAGINGAAPWRYCPRVDNPSRLNMAMAQIQFMLCDPEVVPPPPASTIFWQGIHVFRQKVAKQYGLDLRSQV